MRQWWLPGWLLGILVLVAWALAMFTIVPMASLSGRPFLIGAVAGAGVQIVSLLVFDNIRWRRRLNNLGLRRIVRVGFTVKAVALAGLGTWLVRQVGTNIAEPVPATAALLAVSAFLVAMYLLAQWELDDARIP